MCSESQNSCSLHPRGPRGTELQKEREGRIMSSKHPSWQLIPENWSFMVHKTLALNQWHLCDTKGGAEKNGKENSLSFPEEVTY